MPSRKSAATIIRSTLTATAFLFSLNLAAQQPSNADGWTHYGGDPGGMRYSTSTQITRQNLSQLHPIWTFHTHALDTPRTGSQDASFEATPVLAESGPQATLYFTSPFDVVFALDARTGQQRWSFDPKVGALPLGGIVTSRGVALWQSPTPLPPGQCSRRVLFGTVDARLLANDADTGTSCPGFGESGSIDLTQNVNYQHHGGYGLTSPPTIVGNVVVVGSAVGDNQQVDAESGLVRAFDVVTGQQLWSWEPLPWANNNHPRTGAGNTWSVISADPALGLVYLPTGSASPDYYGGLRPGDNRDADSIVALDVHTGNKVWAFQVVHHNLWDYDVAAQPLLFTAHDGTPAIAVSTKMGQVFVFDRRNGHPLFPIEERPVPQTDVPGEQTSPTQPFSSLPSVSPLTLPPDDPSQFHRSLWNRIVCRYKLHGLRYEGIYTPPSLTGTVLFPGNLGGVNWGSAALDPTTNILYANNNRAAYAATLVPQVGWFLIWHNTVEGIVRDWPCWVFSALGILLLNILYRYIQLWRKSPSAPTRPWLPRPRTLLITACVAAIAIPATIFQPPTNLSHFGHELSPNRNAPYQILRDPITDADDRPCIAPPWGATTALNLNTGTIAWQSPLGSMVPGQNTGILSFGGPIVTASGLLFSAASEDPYLRALDAATGQKLWEYRLPVPAQSTPMTYTLDGRQYLVVAAGGHADHSSFRGDSLIAFAIN